MSESDAALAWTLVQRSPNGVLVTDAAGRIRMVNDALAAMVPLVPDAIGRLPLEAVPVPELAAALAGSGEDRLSIRHGSRYLDVQVVSVGAGQGRMAIVQDVSSRRQAERLRSEFVANVSHELRTPATAISGYAETLLDDRDALDPAVADMVEVIQRNARRLTDLFEDLLVLSRLDAQPGALPTRPVPLLPVVQEAIDKTRALIEARRVHVEVMVPRDMAVSANRDALGHVVGNLVGNAVKYSFEDGIVTVRAQFRRGFVLFEVIDVGIGIDPAYHERIFDRFFRVDKGRSRAAGGTGLGLSIVKKLVDKMGAAIEVRSRPGKGSVFRVLLRPGDEAAEAPTEPVRPG